MRSHRQPNVGRFDQILRLGIGAAFVWVGFVDTTVIDTRVVATLIGLLGLFNLAAALLRVCPFYNLAGITTHHQDD